jgi:5-formyltetrahydrofolate cyclo-ligase
VNKSEIRKKLLKARKLNNNKNLVVKFSNILKILKKEKVKRKIIGGYYPYNYEVDSIQILNKLEKLGYQIALPKIKKNNQMDFFTLVNKKSLYQ